MVNGGDAFSLFLTLRCEPFRASKGAAHEWVAHASRLCEDAKHLSMRAEELRYSLRKVLNGTVGKTVLLPVSGTSDETGLIEKPQQ